MVLRGQPALSLQVLSRDGRRALTITPINDQEFVALDDLAAMFQLTVREDALGALTVSYKGKTIVLTPEQALASVSGRLVSLPAPPARGPAPARRWLVPVEFISRALATISDVRLDLRRPTRLLIVGDLRVPRIRTTYETAPSGVRLVIDATPRVGSVVAQDNDRLVVRLDADALDVSEPLVVLPPQAIVQTIRILEPATLVVELTPRFQGFKASTQTTDNSSRVIIDFVTALVENAAPPAAAPATPPPAVDLNALTQPPSIHTIAIDPGHGGEDQGAVASEGVKEKDITLAVARRAKAVIEGRLGIRVLLTRDDDRAVTLDARAAVANSNKADLFISLHANASFRKSLTGASIFSAAFQPAAQAVARTFSPARLPTFGGGVRDIDIVPWELAQIPYIERSVELARLLEIQFRDRIPLAARPLDTAPLRVLESAHMPAVLIEMGYLTNADQAKQLTTNEFQGTLVQAIYEAVLRFRDVIAPPGVSQ